MKVVSIDHAMMESELKALRAVNEALRWWLKSVGAVAEGVLIEDKNPVEAIAHIYEMVGEMLPPRVTATEEPVRGRLAKVLPFRRN